ncbi:MAG: arylamine N-acetyltransferase [Bacteroidota bacterium]
MDIEAYLSRIGYTGSMEPNKETLFSIQKAHLLSVPFENLDIHYGRKISLNPEQIFDKIIGEKRGGFCYELNGLFYLLLKKLGFELIQISARVYGDDGLGKEFDHLCMLCTLDQEQYLVDVGNGSFSLHPLAFVLEEEQTDPHGKFKLSKFDETYFLVSRFKKGIWVSDYLFSIKAGEYQDFAEMCIYHQTSPDSPFTNKTMCTQATPQGRITFLNDKLTIKKSGQKEKIALTDEVDFRRKLEQYLGITLR